MKIFNADFINSLENFTNKMEKYFKFQWRGGSRSTQRWGTHWLVREGGDRTQFVFVYHPNCASPPCFLPCRIFLNSSQEHPLGRGSMETRIMFYLLSETQEHLASSPLCVPCIDQCNKPSQTSPPSFQWPQPPPAGGRGPSLTLNIQKMLNVLTELIMLTIGMHSESC